MRDPRIIAQSSDPMFAQQNPRMVRISTLRLTYIYTYMRGRRGKIRERERMHTTSHLTH